MRHLTKILLFSFMTVSVVAQEDDISVPPADETFSTESTPPAAPNINFSSSQADRPQRYREIFTVKDMPQTVSFDFDIGEIAIGNPAIASVVADRPRRRIVLSPLEVGETAVLVFDTLGKQRENIQITVTSTDLDQFVRDLAFLFRDIEGLQFRRVGGKVVVEGEVYLKTDLDRIREVLRNNNFVVNLVTLSQDTQRILARRIKDEIRISGVEVGTAKDRIILKGEVASDAESQRAEKIAQIYVDKNQIVNVIAVNPKKSAARAAKIVQVTAHFVELNKSFLRNFNFSWTPIANVQANYNTVQNEFQFFAVLTEFFPKLNTAKALGVARVYESPTISVKSGSRAEIRSGSKLYVANQGEGGGVTYGGDDKGNPLDIGVTLGVTPTADDREFIDMNLNVQVSRLGSATSERNILVSESSVSTEQYVRSGETIAIGGVLRSAFTDVKDAPPTAPFSWQPPFAQQGGGATSSFGNLFQVFKSRAVTQDRSMFIVFITPEVLVSPRDASRHLREQMNLDNVEPVSRAPGESFE